MLVVAINFNVSAQWDNPSERYMDAYKKYEDIKGPIREDEIKHFVYFSRDRDAIVNHPFLENFRFEGAQIMYSWVQLEPSKGVYDFSAVLEDYTYLKNKGKKLFIQIQDATFNPKNHSVPEYLRTDDYNGGEIYQREDNGEVFGWAAKRWNTNVQIRFALLLNALGKEFDGKIEGINLQETAVGITKEYDKTFSPTLYNSSIKINMLALKKAFPNSTTMVYANFMPGEWLPWEDNGYLKSIYQYGEKIGVGLGAPDLMVRRKGQLNHALAMMHENCYSVPLGIAVQDGNYIGQTNSVLVKDKRKNIVPLLHGFAKDFLKVNYMFWVNQEPYFEEDVLSSFISN
ncbi:hypothetical protein EW093_03900 [Thiospirochaeta perfilievii]|uniref:Glycoside hydrolase n=1 Tax=Thiospirochaeta perfilievii TaxID=252967 RepID=A0A5C1QII1_9SPIO|nr:hypothetical protein EW093_03900 [Thiospirochaeta perfilievii]